MSESAKDFQSVIFKLHKAIADYQEGCARIDREFNATKNIERRPGAQSEHKEVELAGRLCQRVGK